MKTVDRIVYYIIIEDFSLDVDDKKKQLKDLKELKGQRKIQLNPTDNI
ncbi:MAG: hypothetical protein IKW37_04490 [Bacteroidaceae bacterium]|nr:hypothetical protein [Bacteroidaceae bacterium]